jgi:hypothetical protein
MRPAPTREDEYDTQQRRTIVSITAIVPSDHDPVRDRAALTLAYGYPQADAARGVGVTDRTIRRWLSDAAFVSLVETYRARALYELGAQLEKAQLEAVAKLIELMHTGRDSVQATAARTLIDEARKTREEVSYLRRLAALEQTVAAAALDEAPE